MSQVSIIDIEGNNPQIPTEFIEDTGSAVPLANQLEILGQKTPSNVPVMWTLGSGNTVSIENRTWETPYVVDASATVGLRGTFQTIQAAIDQAVTDGAATGNKFANILIRNATFTTYTENLTISGVRIHLKGLLPDPNVRIAPTGGTSIIGSITFTGAGSLFLENLFVSNNNSATIINTTSGVVYAFNSYIQNPTFTTGQFVAYSCTIDSMNATTGGLLELYDCDLAVSTNFTLADTATCVMTRCNFVSSNAKSIVLTGTTSPFVSYCKAMSFSGAGNGVLTIQDSTIINPINLASATVRASNVSQDLTQTTITDLITNIPTAIFKAYNGNVYFRRIVSTSGNVTHNDQYVGCTQSAALALILVVTSCIRGQQIIIADESGNAATNNITITPSAGLINGAATFVIKENYASAVLIFDGTNWFTSSYLTSSTKITTYNVSDSPGTWTKDSRTKVVEVFAWGSGAGGGSGRKGTTALSCGGGGGSCGGYAYYKAPATSFNTTENFVVGAGGAGGASQTATADGNPGIIGNVTTFGSVKALAGNFGSGGTSATGGAGAAVASGGYNIPTATGSAGGAGSTTVGGVGQVVGGSRIAANASSGGGGGCANTATERAGGIGGNNLDFAAVVVLAGGTAGLESTGINGGNGNVPLSTGGLFSGGTGGGGGGGYSVGAGGATKGGTGGNGAVPGGGGGGGGGGIAAVADSGAGGNGANGRIIVIEYF